MELIRAEIGARLELLPPRIVVAFIARTVLRAFPTLLVGSGRREQSLKPWRKRQRKNYLLELFYVYQKIWVGSLGGVGYDHPDVVGRRVFVGGSNDLAKAISAAAAVLTGAVDVEVIDTLKMEGDASFDEGRAEIAVRKIKKSQSNHAILSVSAAMTAVSNVAGSGGTFLSALVSDLEGVDQNTDLLTYMSSPVLPTFEMERFHEKFVAQLNTLGYGFDYWADWYADRVAGEFWSREEMQQSVGIPKEILMQSAARVNGYLRAIRDERLESPLNRVRAIFIGYGAAGKTSLIRRLHGETVVEGKEKMTPGIKIREWPLPNSDIKGLLWDFGGQVMAHSTHQFFLRERCAYVIVLDGRTDVPGNEQAEYWLEHVRAFGADAPVLLVGNKADMVPVHLDMYHLKERYPNIVGFYPLSCTDPERFGPEYDAFLRDFTAQLQAVGTHQVLFPSAHAKVLEALRDRSPVEAFLDKGVYEALCDQHGVPAEGELDRVWLLDLLDKLGVIVHFREIDWLGGYVLNPRWLTYGVYTLLYRGGEIGASGRLSEGEIIAQLQAEEVTDELGNRLSYPPDKCRFIIDAMEQFQLCYRLPQERATVVIPDLLPSDRPAELEFDKASAMAFDFDFEGLLPRHLMSALIVQRHAEISGERVWQHGVRLTGTSLEAEALIQADYHNRRLSLWVTGSQAGRYFSALHDQVMQMLGRMPKLRYDEWVGLPEAGGDTRRRALFRDLLALEAKGVSHHTCRFGTFPLSELLGIMPEEIRSKQRPFDVGHRFDPSARPRRPFPKTDGDDKSAPLLFISYAHEDKSLLDELHKRLVPLKRSGQIRTWQDGEIAPGSEWAGAIRDNLERAAVVLLLVSPDFIASDYCWGVEMTHAMEQHEADDVRVIPVILRPEATWRTAPFGKLQAVPEGAKPVTKWEDRDEAWADVVERILKAIEELG